jgi:hypothetical protein
MDGLEDLRGWLYSPEGSHWKPCHLAALPYLMEALEQRRIEAQKTKQLADARQHLSNIRSMPHPTRCTKHTAHSLHSHAPRTSSHALA